MEYPGTLRQQSSGQFLEFRGLTFEGEDDLREKKRRTLWSPVIDVVDEQPDRSDRDVVRTRLPLTRELVMGYLKSNESRLWVARTQAGIFVWLCWLATVLSLDRNSVLPCSFSRNGKVLKLTRRDAKLHTRHNYSAARDGESLRCFFNISGEVGAYFYVSPGSQLQVYYTGAQKNGVQRGLCDRRSANSATFLFRGSRLRAARR